MLSSSIPHYIYQRNHVWWFRKRFVAQGSVVEYRLSLKTSNLNHARLCALRLQTLCLQLVASHGAPKKCKSDSMDKTTQDHIRAKLRAKVAEWTAEQTEEWYSGGQRSEGEYNSYLEIIDMLCSDLRERIALNDRPHLAQAEADSILDDLPHLKASLSEYDIQQIAREVAQAKLKSLQKTRANILGEEPDWIKSSLPVITSVLSNDQEDTRLLSELLKKYTEENNAKEYSGRTQQKYEWYVALILSFFGDVPVHTITGAMGRQFYESLSKLPLHLKKESLLTSKLSVLLENSDNKPISLVTANGHHGKINQFFEWVVDKKHINSSPFPSKGIPMPKKNHKDDRQPITDAEAKRVFSHSIFTRHEGIKTKLIQHPHHYFLPLICLFTGMRAGEVSQLYVDDIIDVDSVHCFLIDKRHADQWLKTPNAKRYIPVHHRLIELGFLDFVRDLKVEQDECSRLFPNIPKIQDSYSAKPSEWFIRNFRNALGQPKHVTLHGFRHMFRDKLVNLTHSDEQICRLMGHQTSNYGSSLLADQRVMQNLINSVDFSGITSNVKPYTSLTIFHSLDGRA